MQPNLFVSLPRYHLSIIREIIYFKKEEYNYKTFQKNQSQNQNTIKKSAVYRTERDLTD